MKSIYLTFFLLSLFLICLESCHTHTFLPQTQNVPLFTKDSQLQVSSALTYRSAELQLAYSPLNHLGVIANGFLGNYSRMGELGVGAYYSYDNKFITEMYGGYGSGYNQAKIKKESFGFNSLTQNGYYNYDINLKTNWFFIQPDVGIRFNNKISLALSAKVCYWTFPKYYYYAERWESDHSNPSIVYLGKKDSINITNGKQVTFEPAITFKVGGKYAKFMIQTGVYMLNNVSKGSINPYNNFPVFVRLGMNADVDFSKIKSRREYE
jgi:hypothetical protein